jgi:hypothetical protein
VLLWITEWKERKEWKVIHEFKLPKKPQDMVIKTAIESHIRWVDKVLAYVNNPEETEKPPIDSHECRFGLWYYGTGTVRYGHLSGYADIDPLHEEIHRAARHLFDMKLSGNQAETLKQVNELLGQRDRFVEVMKHFIKTIE